MVNTVESLWFVIDGLAEMVCDGGMIAMISHGRDEPAGLWQVHWYNGLSWVIWMKWFDIYSRDEMARRGWNEWNGSS